MDETNYPKPTAWHDSILYHSDFVQKLFSLTTWSYLWIYTIVNLYVKKLHLFTNVCIPCLFSSPFPCVWWAWYLHPAVPIMLCPLPLLIHLLLCKQAQSRLASYPLVQTTSWCSAEYSSVWSFHVQHIITSGKCIFKALNVVYDMQKCQKAWF